MNDSYGVWKVETEGDCECRTRRDLGTHAGHLDEIAFALADKACYTLQFTRVDIKALDTTPKATEVNVSLPIETGTWDMGPVARKEYYERLLTGRDITIAEGASYYAAVKMVRGKTPESREAARRKSLVDAATKKLSPEELQALKESM